MSEVIEALMRAQCFADEAAIRDELLRAFLIDEDCRPVVLWRPGERWRSDYGVVQFPEQQRIYL